MAISSFAVSFAIIYCMEFHLSHISYFFAITSGW